MGGCLNHNPITPSLCRLYRCTNGEGHAAALLPLQLNVTLHVRLLHRDHCEGAESCFILQPPSATMPPCLNMRARHDVDEDLGARAGVVRLHDLPVPTKTLRP